MDSPRTTSRPRSMTSTGSGSPPSVWTTTPPASPTWPGSLMTLGNQPTICSRTTRSPRPEESDRRRLRLRRADARRHGRDFAGPAGGRSCCCRCASVLGSFLTAMRMRMNNGQLKHSHWLAFDEQRHQDIASIGKFDRVVMAMRHIWFDHTKLGNAEAGCSRPDPSLVVLNVSLEG